MKLNGWQRIGVVASALWAIGAAINVRSDQVSFAKTIRSSALSNCSPFTEACIDKAHEKYVSLLSLDFDSVFHIVFVAVWPVLLGWVLAYLIVKIVRWVKAGF